MCELKFIPVEQIVDCHGSIKPGTYLILEGKSWANMVIIKQGDDALKLLKGRRLLCNDSYAVNVRDVSQNSGIKQKQPSKERCGKPHNMYAGFSCVLEKGHDGWCGCAYDGVSNGN